MGRERGREGGRGRGGRERRQTRPPLCSTHSEFLFGSRSSRPATIATASCGPASRSPGPSRSACGFFCEGFVVVAAALTAMASPGRTTAAIGGDGPVACSRGMFLVVEPGNECAATVRDALSPP